MKVLFIGSLNINNAPLGGDQYKNQLFLQQLMTTNFECKYIDTYRWKNRPLTLLKLIIHTLSLKYDRYIISTASSSAYNLIRFLNLFSHRLNRTVYLVIGGYLPTGIKAGLYKKNIYKKLKNIVIEGDLLRNEMLALGIQNVTTVPNLKKIIELPLLIDRTHTTIRFVFLARITPFKGVKIIFEAISILQKENYKNRFTVTFYGPIDPSFTEEFYSGLPKCAEYKKFLNIIKEPEQSYEILSGYHCMLFPTYWPSEGFPGTLIDAFIAGLPVIASDWNMNSEVITNYDNGLLIPPKDAPALAKAMKLIIDNPSLAERMAINARRKASNYDIEKVWPLIEKTIRS